MCVKLFCRFFFKIHSPCRITGTGQVNKKDPGFVTPASSMASSSSPSSLLSSISSMTSAFASATSSRSGRFDVTDLTKGCWRHKESAYEVNGGGREDRGMTAYTSKTSKFKVISSFFKSSSICWRLLWGSRKKKISVAHETHSTQPATGMFLKSNNIKYQLSLFSWQKVRKSFNNIHTCRRYMRALTGWWRGSAELREWELN